GLVSEHAANTESLSTSSFVPLSLTPNARRQRSLQLRMIAIDTAGILNSSSQCGIPTSHPATSDSRKASLGTEQPERYSAERPSPARQLSIRNSRRCTWSSLSEAPINQLEIKSPII